MNYNDKLQRLKQRRTDKNYLYKSFSTQQAEALLTEDYERLDLPPSVRYAIGSMEEVDKLYTVNTFAEGDRVKKQLEVLKENGFICTFKYQGSVTNNTHIKHYSDIDLLVIYEKFFFLEPPLKPNSPYQGNWHDELITLREKCFDLLFSAYPAAKVDNSGTYSIALSGGSLARDIDVVPAVWYETVKYQIYHQEYYKGIQVYDKDSAERSANYPFLNNFLIEEKDNKAISNYRKVVRLFKTLIADSDKKIDISSYDIVALFYHMPNDKFNVSKSLLTLLSNATQHLFDLFLNESKFKSLKVPDESRLISDKVKQTDLAPLMVEADNLEKEIIRELTDVNRSINMPIEITRRLYG